MERLLAAEPCTRSRHAPRLRRPEQKTVHTLQLGYHFTHRYRGERRWPGQRDRVGAELVHSTIATARASAMRVHQAHAQPPCERSRHQSRGDKRDREARARVWLPQSLRLRSALQAPPGADAGTLRHQAFCFTPSKPYAPSNTHWQLPNKNQKAIVTLGLEDTHTRNGGGQLVCRCGGWMVSATKTPSSSAPSQASRFPLDM